VTRSEVACPASLPARTIGVVRAKDKFQTEAAWAFLAVLRRAGPSSCLRLRAPPLSDNLPRLAEWFCPAAGPLYSPHPIEGARTPFMISRSGSLRVTRL
jgi:hypothetical protein